MMIDDRPRRGLIASFFAGLWWLVDGTRRLVLNLLFVAIAIALLYAWLGGGPPKLREQTVLVLDLKGPIVEQFSGSARDSALAQLQGQERRETRLRDVLAALEAAARDEHIASVLLLTEELEGGGLATQREVAAALQRFRASGKKVVAWGAAFDQRRYYLAAHADEVYLHPMGAVMPMGYGRLRNYYRDAFERLGVSANVVRAGKFKNAGEPFFASGPSPETLESEGFVYVALWKLTTEGIERARRLPAGSLMQLIDALPGNLVEAGGSAAELALKAKLVDGLKTRDELRALLIERGVLDDKTKSFRQVNLAGYLAHVKDKRDGDAVAVIVAEGEIGDGIAPPGRIGGLSTAELIRRARDDEKVKAVVLRVDSPGGSAYGSELIRRELELTRTAGKPVVVSMGDLAASGGYWISLAADELIADAATITGSIGVFGLLPTADGLMDKASLRVGGIGTTWLATAYDPRKPLDPRFAELVQVAIGRIYTDFTAKAAAARRTTPEKIDAVAQGRIWTGAQAVERGLVDRVGSLGDAIAAARTRAGLGEEARVDYRERAGSRLQRVIGWFTTALAPGLDLPPLLGPAVPALPGSLQAMQQDLAWLADVAERRQPFAAVVHCLCEPGP